MKEMESAGQERKTRRELLATIGILSLSSLWIKGIFAKKDPVISCAPPVEKETMKLLSQTGQLLEVDVSKIKSIQGKISDLELQGWVKRQ